MLTLARTVNPLVFPGHRLPGFDPTHPAANGIRPGNGFSGISFGANFINLLNGNKGTIAGAPTGSIKAAIARATLFPTSSDGCTFSASTADPTAITVAAIVIFAALSGTYQTIVTLNSASTYPLLLTSTGKVGAYYNGDNSTTFTPVANVPYFMATSLVSGADPNFVIVNLNTGSILSPSPAQISTIPSGGYGTYTIGAAGGNGSNVYVAAAAINNSLALPMSSLLQWAQDPWSFWYPPAVEQLIFDSMSGVISPVIIPNPYTLMPQIVT